MEIIVKPIGTIHSPFKTKDDISTQRNADPRGFDSIRGTLEILPAHTEGLKDIDGFSHLILLFSFHKSREEKHLVRPPYETEERGVFSSRSPHRPNFIGMTVVRLHKTKENILEVSGIDMLDGTPILDIKPYITQDLKTDISLGWMDKD